MPERWRNCEIKLIMVHGPLDEPSHWSTYEPLVDDIIEVTERHFPAKGIVSTGGFVEVEEGEPVTELELAAAAKAVVRLAFVQDIQLQADASFSRRFDQAIVRLRDAIGRFGGDIWSLQEIAALLD
jgi:hypothetical protein